ncbi:MAG: hypothetical protein AAFO96_03545 [Bacteroidota bacterium]
MKQYIFLLISLMFFFTSCYEITINPDHRPGGLQGIWSHNLSTFHVDLLNPMSDDSTEGLMMNLFDAGQGYYERIVFYDNWIYLLEVQQTYYGKEITHKAYQLRQAPRLRDDQQFVMNKYKSPGSLTVGNGELYTSWTDPAYVHETLNPYYHEDRPSVIHADLLAFKIVKGSLYARVYLPYNDSKRGSFKYLSRYLKLHRIDV